MLRARVCSALVAMLTVVMSVSCDEHAPSIPLASEPPSSSPTWDDVAPILTERCITCHRAGALAPFSLTTYEAARTQAGRIAAAVRERRMPPWGAIDSETCRAPRPFRDDPRLSTLELSTLTTWAEAGAPLGRGTDPTRSPPELEAPASPAALDANMELAPRSTFTLEEDRDRFVCVVLEPPIASASWITGLEVVPGAREVVHHAVVLADADGALASSADAEGRFECPGIPMGSARTSVLGTWLPGSAPVTFPDGAAMAVSAGTRLVVQMHYSAPGRLGARDATRVRLRTLAAEETPRYLVYNGVWGNADGPLAGGDGLQPGPDDPPSGPAFFIRAGAVDHLESMRVTVPSPPAGVVAPEARILGLLPHAHFAAVRVTASLERDGAATCLVDDRWDAHWQRLYSYDAALEDLPLLLPGDRIHVRCRYDNTLGNARLASALAERRLPLRDITYGERTTDEMCVVFPQLLFRLR